MKLLYFAWVREKTGVGSEDVTLPENIQTISQLIDWLISRGPEFEAAFAKRKVIRTAINQEHVRHDASILKATEIAFFPPVTGG